MTPPVGSAAIERRARERDLDAPSIPSTRNTLAPQEAFGYVRKMADPILAWLLSFGANKALSAGLGKAGELWTGKSVEMERTIATWADGLPTDMACDPRSLFCDLESLDTEPVTSYRHAAEEDLGLTVETLFEAVYDLWAKRKATLLHDDAQALFQAEASKAGPHLLDLAKRMRPILDDDDYVPLQEVLDTHYSLQLIACRAADTPFTTTHLLFAILKCPTDEWTSQPDILSKVIAETERAVMEMRKTRGYHRSSGCCQAMAKARSTAVKQKLARVTPLVLLECILRNPGQNVSSLLARCKIEGPSLLRQYEKLSPLISWS
jgi:hypothetical protein